MFPEGPGPIQGEGGGPSQQVGSPARFKPGTAPRARRLPRLALSGCHVSSTPWAWFDGGGGGLVGLANSVLIGQFAAIIRPFYAGALLVPLVK